MEVIVYDEQSDLKISSASVKNIVSQVVVEEGQSFDEAAVYFVDTKRISALHKDYLNDPSPTDCLSFPIDDFKTDGYRVMGDAFICPKTAINYTKEHGGDPYEETTLYLVHCLLHLMGYDDQGSAEPQMRAAEKKHMKKLKDQNLLLEE